MRVVRRRADDKQEEKAKGGTFPIDRTVADADPSEYVGLVLPGEVANPDQLRTDDDAVRFVRAFSEAGSRSARSVTRRGP